MAADSSGSMTYQLTQLSNVQLEDSEKLQPQFVCSRRGVTERGRPCERVCALQDRAVHILTYICDDEGSDVAPECTHAIAELDARAESASFNASASCVVVGDASGKLHFLLVDGTLLFSQQLVRPLAASATAGPSTLAFHAIRFAAPSSTSESAATEELVAISTSLQLIHICNISTSGLEAAAHAQDAAALKSLRSALSVHTATVPTAQPAPSVDLALHWLPNSSLIYVAAAGLSVWSCKRVAGAPLQLLDSAPANDSSTTAVHNSSSSLYGGGQPTALQLSATGAWAVLTDSEGGLSWWDAVDLLQLARWVWRDRGAITSVALLSQEAAAAQEPCVAAVFAPGPASAGCISVLQLSTSGAVEVFNSNAVAPGTLLTAPYGYRFLAVSAVADAGACVALGREAVPLHRLRLLLSTGHYEDALSLARYVHCVNLMQAPKTNCEMLPLVLLLVSWDTITSVSSIVVVAQ
jgi:hypothetical protein